jgi:hypothetical protein
VPGYEHNQDAARAMLAWLEARFDVDPVIGNAVRSLLAEQPPDLRATLVE